MLAEALFGTASSVLVQTLFAGPAILVLAWRLRIDRKWLSVIPIGTAWTVSDVAGLAGRRRWANAAALGILAPVLVGLFSALSQATSTSRSEVGGWLLVAAMLACGLGLAACAGLWLSTWSSVCVRTGQSGHMAWLFLVPMLNFAMPWVVALRADAARATAYRRQAVVGVAADDSYVIDFAPTSAESAKIPELGSTPSSKRSKQAGIDLPRARIPPWVLSNLAIGLAFAFYVAWDVGALGKSGKVSTPTPTLSPSPTRVPEPDRVVNILETCEFLDLRYATNHTCREAVARKRAINHRKEITVRTAAGATYVVTVGADEYVLLRVGDKFPP